MVESLADTFTNHEPEGLIDHTEDFTNYNYTSVGACSILLWRLPFIYNSTLVESEMVNRDELIIFSYLRKLKTFVMNIFLKRIF